MSANENESGGARVQCECGGAGYPGGWCFGCGKYLPSEKQIEDETRDPFAEGFDMLHSNEG